MLSAWATREEGMKEWEGVIKSMFMKDASAECMAAFYEAWAKPAPEGFDSVDEPSWRHSRQQRLGKTMIHQNVAHQAVTGHHRRRTQMR